MSGTNDDMAHVYESFVTLCSKYPVDKIGLCNVNDSRVVKDCRELIQPIIGDIKIVSKIDSKEGLKNFEDILHASDCIKLDRTTLSHEIGSEKVFVAQKYMIEKANMAGKCFITGSKLLESVELSSKPSRAETSDVSNSVLDGTTYIMLATKTSNGNHLVKSLDLLSKCCIEAEKMNEFKIMNYHDEPVEEIIRDPYKVEEAV